VRDAVDVAAATDECRDVDGEIVWSWRSGASAKFARTLTRLASDGDKQPVPEEITYKP
jgi:hypothetical protein